MKTTLDLPADLLEEIRLRARRDDRKLKDIIADLLRAGLVNVADRRNPQVPNAAMLRRRRAMTKKFVSADLGVELVGFEESRASDRAKALGLEAAWRE